MVNKDIEALIKNDYKGAVIDLLWTSRKDNCEEKSQLLFMSLEFYPKEINEYFISPRKTTTKDEYCIHHERFHVDVMYAINLYKSLGEKRCFIPIIEEGQTKNVINVNSFIEFPQWPIFYLSKKSDISPYIPDWCGTCRTSHKISCAIDGDLFNLINDDDIRKWCEDELQWDIAEVPELLGSIHIILPNPVYRDFSIRLHPSKQNDYKILGYFTTREGIDINRKKIHVLTMEKSQFGITKYNSIDVKKNCIIIDTSGVVDRFAYVVVSDEHGILDYSEFNSFMYKIKLNIEAPFKERRVEICDQGKDDYTVPIITDEKRINIGTVSKRIELIEKLNKRDVSKKNKRKAYESGQILFKMGEEKEAQKYIRELIGQARERVVIVDPYFSVIELYKYILSIPRSRVIRKIITSHTVLKRKKNINDEGRKAEGIYLNNKINEECSEFNIKVKVKVMIEKHIPIHDRFLIIDNSVYFSGNSLNHIGSKASMMVKIDYVDDILQLIRDIEEKCIDLSQWVDKQNEKNKKTKEKDCK